MIIRRADKNDIDGINTLLYQVNNVHADGRSDLFIHGRKKYTDSELLQIIYDDTRPIYVALNDRQIVGYAFCVYEEPKSANLVSVKTMYIDDICVLESKRGKHIGTEIYNFVHHTL